MYAFNLYLFIQMYLKTEITIHIVLIYYHSQNSFILI